MMTSEELYGQQTDAIRAAVQAELRAMFTTLPGILKKQGDGHNVTVNSAIQGIQRMDDGSFQPFQIPYFDTMPVHFPAGGLVVATHPVHAGDEGIILFSARAIDTWRQSGGVQNPIDARQHHASDAFWIGGVKSDPNKIQNYAPDSHQVRSLDARVTHEVHPVNGLTARVVDPSDNSPNPFASAIKFYQTIHNSVAGLIHSAVQSGITHLVSLTHAAGHLISVANGEHTASVHPTNGIGLNTIASIAQNATQNIGLTAQQNLTAIAQQVLSATAPTTNITGQSVLNLLGGAVNVSGSSVGISVGTNGISIGSGGISMTGYTPSFTGIANFDVDASVEITLQAPTVTVDGTTHLILEGGSTASLTSPSVTIDGTTTASLTSSALTLSGTITASLSAPTLTVNGSTSLLIESPSISISSGTYGLNIVDAVDGVELSVPGAGVIILDDDVHSHGVYSLFNSSSDLCGTISPLTIGNIGITSNVAITGGLTVNGGTPVFSGVSTVTIDGTTALNLTSPDITMIIGSYGLNFVAVSTGVEISVPGSGVIILDDEVHSHGNYVLYNSSSDLCGTIYPGTAPGNMGIISNVSITGTLGVSSITTLGNPLIIQNGHTIQFLASDGVSGGIPGPYTTSANAASSGLERGKLYYNNSISAGTNVVCMVT